MPCFIAQSVELFTADREAADLNHNQLSRGLSGGAKASCILRHRDVQLILACSWARPALLVADKGRGGWFYLFCFFTFIPVLLSSLFLCFIPSTVSFLPRHDLNSVDKAVKRFDALHLSL